MKIIGIDLGTSNSAAAVLEGGRPTLVPSAEGTTLYGKAFPSYVAFTTDGQRLVGEPARRQAVANPDGTVSAFKRKMGTDLQVQGAREGILPAGTLRHTTPEDKEGRGGVPWRDGDEGRHNRASVLQRQPEAGHEGCRGDSRARGGQAGERADGSVPGVRAWTSSART